MQTPAVDANGHICCVGSEGRLRSVQRQREKRVHKIVTTVCHSKEDMKQGNREKMRKWSHTLSTCSKTSHPHSPPIDHGSRCHWVYFVLSFLWFTKIPPSVTNFLGNLFGLLLPFLVLSDGKSRPPQQRRILFSRPSHETVPVHLANGWSGVYTHLMLFHTRVHSLGHISVPVWVCVCCLCLPEEN